MRKRKLNSNLKKNQKQMRQSFTITDFRIRKKNKTNVQEEKTVKKISGVLQIMRKGNKDTV